MSATQPNRCPWCGDAPDYQQYHDEVWGRPVYDPKDLFAKLCLDGQQAGLSWITILRKQSGYERAFFDLDPLKIAAITGAEREQYVNQQMNNTEIIRNRLKIESIFRNADAFVALEKSGTDFSDWLWSFVGGSPVINYPTSMTDIPTETEESRQMSKALRKAGFNFVGPTIVYAFMQAVGMVDDHLTDCEFK